eukprot:TRINITY_DN295_c0_g1_i1.p1 TRINITY_DN295_c0_g1~~TRINITY_DN295_c0_g1_i1.p1  ORF type:complete len:110 (+),score=50.11 TRINITY_DN295_c0_g1_i1:94-423(+)
MLRTRTVANLCALAGRRQAFVSSLGMMRSEAADGMKDREQSAEALAVKRHEKEMKEKFRAEQRAKQQDTNKDNKSTASQIDGKDETDILKGNSQSHTKLKPGKVGGVIP